MNREELEKIYPNVQITYGEVFPSYHWNKCSDKMPDKEGRYIVYEGIRYNWIGVMSLRNGKWDSEAVSHWMHLPNKPEDKKC